MIGAALVLCSLQAGQIVVGSGSAVTSIGDGLELAGLNDTVLVLAGVYHEHLRVATPLVLIGREGAVIDGGGMGTVLQIDVPAVVSGFTIRGSGSSQADEDTGILITGAPGVVIENNRLEDVLFGIYVKQSDGPRIVGNYVQGKEIPIPLRGDGIRLWYSHNGVVEGNLVSRSRDVVVWFSNHTEVSGNSVSDSRYGLHYMYSDHNVFRDNCFVGNDVGAFLMYSNDIRFEANTFAGARGVAGRGLGFKDTDSIYAEDNLIIGNAIGVFVDNSPTTLGVENYFRGNVIAFNEVGVQLLPSVQSNRFTDNQFIGNVRPVTVTGGGNALANLWSDNYWSGYAGFDEDGDGRGDTPFIYERLSDNLLDEHEELRIFSLGLTTASLDLLSRAVPLLKPAAVMIDSFPRIESEIGRAQRADSPPGPRAAVLSLLGIALAGVAATASLRRSR